MRRVATAALLLLLSAVADANLFNVLWSSGVNYTDWASDKKFYVGDWLRFVFNKYQYSVLEVNQTNYEKCIETEFLMNVTKGGRDVFQLNESRPYFFISGFGQCWGGVKLAINVENVPPPNPSPTKSATNALKVSGLLMFLVYASSIMLLVL